MKADWADMPIGKFLIPAREAMAIRDEAEYDQITVALHGRGVRLRQRVLGAAIKTKNQFRARSGRFIYSRIDARNGAMGIVPDELDGAAISGDFPTFDFDRDVVAPRFFEYMTKTKVFEDMCVGPSKGVTNRKRLKEAELLGMRVLLPPLPEQQRLLATIDQIAKRVNESLRLADQIEEEHTALLLRRVEEMSKGVPLKPMNEVAPVIRRKVETKPDEWYPELGIRSFGRGTFHKDPVNGAELGRKRLYRIEPGDLIFSNVFSWEGAIAVVRPQDEGRFGSHRFITCVPEPDLATARFLCYWFLSPEGLADIRAASPGAAGRNRTLGIKKLEAIEVPLPPIEQQHEFAELVKQVQRARTTHEQTVASLDALMPAVLDQAFRGELLEVSA